ncbi:MAG: hypothetical protein MHMPM18_002503 [Marteilia pararefringens]
MINKLIDFITNYSIISKFRLEIQRDITALFQSNHCSKRHLNFYLGEIEIQNNAKFAFKLSLYSKPPRIFAAQMHAEIDNKELIVFLTPTKIQETSIINTGDSLAHINALFRECMLSNATEIMARYDFLLIQSNAVIYDPKVFDSDSEIFTILDFSLIHSNFEIHCKYDKLRLILRKDGDLWLVFSVQNKLIESMVESGIENISNGSPSLFIKSLPYNECLKFSESNITESLDEFIERNIVIKFRYYS